MCIPLIQRIRWVQTLINKPLEGIQDSLKAEISAGPKTKVLDLEPDEEQLDIIQQPLFLMSKLPNNSESLET